MWEGSMTNEQVYLHKSLKRRMKYLNCVAILLNYNDGMSQPAWKTKAIILALRNPTAGGAIRSCYRDGLRGVVICTILKPNFWTSLKVLRVISLVFQVLTSLSAWISTYPSSFIAIPCISRAVISRWFPSLIHHCHVGTQRQCSKTPHYFGDGLYFS